MNTEGAWLRASRVGIYWRRRSCSALTSSWWACRSYSSASSARTAAVLGYAAASCCAQPRYCAARARSWMPPSKGFLVKNPRLLNMPPRNPSSRARLLTCSMSARTPSCGQIPGTGRKKWARTSYALPGLNRFHAYSHGLRRGLQSAAPAELAQGLARHLNQRGKVTVKVVPGAGLAVSSTVPLWASAIHFTIDRPRPKPPS